MPELDTNLVLKSLVYFKDIEIEPIIFKNERDLDLKEIKAFFIKVVQEYYAKQETA